MALFSEYYVGDTTAEEGDKEGATPFVNTCLCDRREYLSLVSEQCTYEMRQNLKNADISDDTFNTTQCVYLIVPSL